MGVDHQESGVFQHGALARAYKRSTTQMRARDLNAITTADGRHGDATTSYHAGSLSTPPESTAPGSGLGQADSAAATPFKVLLVVRHPVGGIRTFFRYVYRHFSPAKYRFTLIAPECAEARMLLDDLDTLRLSFIPLASGAGDRDFARAVTRSIRSGQFDLIHSHGFTSGVASVVGSLLTRTPHLLTCHDVFTDNQFVGLNGLARKTVLGLALATIDRIHCVSDDARMNLLDYLGHLRAVQQRIRTIRNGIEVERFLNVERRDLRSEYHLGDDTFLIGFLGRFMSQKGFRYLVDALSEIRKRSDLPKRPIVLTFGGQAGYYREEMAQIERRGLQDSVFFLPFMSNVASTMKGLDVVAMPSLWESCGLVAMEAMVAGIPVIGSNCVGLREVLSDTPARIVPPRDSTALADALVAEMIVPSTQYAREFVPVAASRFAVDEQAAGLERLMLELL